MEEPGKEDQGGTGLPTLSGRSQDWAAEGSKCQHRGGEMEEEVGRVTGWGWGKGAAVMCPEEGAITHPPTPTVTRAPGRFHRLSDLSSQGLWGHRLVQLRANSTAGNKQQPSSQLVSWAPALLRGIHRPTQSWPASSYSGPYNIPQKDQWRRKVLLHEAPAFPRPPSAGV